MRWHWQGENGVSCENMLIDEYSYVTKRCGFSTVMPLIHHEWWLRLELRQLQDPNIAFLDTISGNGSLKQE